MENGIKTELWMTLTYSILFEAILNFYSRFAAMATALRTENFKGCMF
jgi:hypothetical protein